jgi:hypothetical protein
MKTIQQTKAAAIALLAPLSSDAHVAADAAENGGQHDRAALLRDEADLPHSGYRELTVESAHVPRTLRGFKPREILAHFLADIDDVLGANRYGVNVERAATEIVGESMPIWEDVLGKPLRVQQALVMNLIAEIRSARAMSKVYRGISA